MKIYARSACCTEKVKDEKFLKNGKGIYVGESSRSLYERAKEHQAEKENLSEDSHQVKHWLTSHQEMSSPPEFKFRIIQTFRDPLSRQLAEAVRIDLRGEDVLNSRSEYSRCRVPRLRIDMEDWTGRKDQDGVKKKGATQKEDNTKVKEAEESLCELELKRKAGELPAVRKNKRRNLDRLMGWGENQDEVILLEGSRLDTTPAVPDRSMGPSMEEDGPYHEEGNPSLKEGKQHQVKLKKSKPAEKPFKFNKRGKLKDKEIKELARTSKNILDWLKPGLTTIEAGTGTGLEEDHVTGTEADWLREERLELVRRMQTSWNTTRMCKELLLDMMETTVSTRIKPSEESVVVLGSQIYTDRHGGVHTPLPRPLTIAEKGVD